MYLVLNRREVVRMLKTERRASLGSHERLVAVDVTADDSLWHTPQLSASFHLSAGEVAHGDIVIEPVPVGSAPTGDASTALARVASGLLERCLECGDEALRKLALDSATASLETPAAAIPPMTTKRPISATRSDPSETLSRMLNSSSQGR